MIKCLYSSLLCLKGKQGIKSKTGGIRFVSSFCKKTNNLSVKTIFLQEATSVWVSTSNKDQHLGAGKPLFNVTFSLFFVLLLLFPLGQKRCRNGREMIATSKCHRKHLLAGQDTKHKTSPFESVQCSLNCCPFAKRDSRQLKTFCPKGTSAPSKYKFFKEK